MRSRSADRLCVDAVALARAAAEEMAGAAVVGDHLGAVAEGDRVVTHSFACTDPAYRGWRWAVTVARASRAKAVTVDESVLLPDADAVLAPEWVPWSERLRPGDMGPGDLLPTDADDLRLEAGWLTAGSSANDDAPASGPDAGGDRESGDTAVLAARLGLRRARVLSRYGLHSAADRWEEGFGTKTPMAQAAPAQCVSCGFLVPLAGSLSQAFGVCTNEFGPADGRVVSLAFGCGGHSEAAVLPAPLRPPPMVLDEMGADPLT